MTFASVCATDGCTNPANGKGAYCTDCTKWYGLFNSDTEDSE